MNIQKVGEMEVSISVENDKIIYGNESYSSLLEMYDSDVPLRMIFGPVLREVMVSKSVSVDSRDYMITSLDRTPSAVKWLVKHLVETPVLDADLVNSFMSIEHWRDNYPMIDFISALAFTGSEISDSYIDARTAVELFNKSVEYLDRYDLDFDQDLFYYMDLSLTHLYVTAPEEFSRINMTSLEHSIESRFYDSIKELQANNSSPIWLPRER